VVNFRGSGKLESGSAIGTEFVMLNKGGEVDDRDREAYVQNGDDEGLPTYRVAYLSGNVLIGLPGGAEAKSSLSRCSTATAPIKRNVLSWFTDHGFVKATVFDASVRKVRAYMYVFLNS